ncbi:MAG: hypothetical protein N2322_02940, partial [Terrimicrobiaceae bacterium]|nr:hypothetical protein [Terrimicrobiaceae bacterium]
LDPPVEAVRRLLPEHATSPAPPGAELLAAAGSGIFLGGDGRLWFSTPAEGPRELGIAAPQELWSMSAGPEETVWITGRDEQGPCLRQISAAGEILRHLNLSPSANHARAFADPQRLRVFILETLPVGQRVLGIEPAPNAPPTEGVADWQIICDRSISSFRDFGFSDGGVVADGAQPSPRTFSIRLSPSNWQKEPGSLSVTLESAENALWLATTSGLRLLKICEPAPRQFAACWRASEAELRILAARDAVVEEFAVENLSKIIPLDGGGISSEP